ncbi:hypothetical protein ACFW04_010507 [Cataglyphis niger]
MCLDKLNKTGADVKLITCDQATNNQAVYSQLGVDVQEPYFMYNNKKYYASYDFPHLIKRLASFLRTHDKIYCKGKIIASYSDFVKTWYIDNVTKGGSNLLSHITQAHIRPNCFEAMNVKRAFQLFSHRFAAAIKIAGDQKELDSSTWKATADFTEYMNNVIDACNSYSLNVIFGGKRPLSRKNPDIEDLLSNFVQWSSGWSKFPDKIYQVPCFKGFIITTQAILTLYKELASKNEGFELATGLCNQDAVEHLFSKIRQRGGFNPNPTARMVRLSFRHIISTGYIQTSDKGNVQWPERYVARRCIEKSNCQNCRATMLKTPMEDATPNEKYIEYREYPNIDEDAPTVTKLTRPTSLFIDIIKTQLMSFNRTWQHHWASSQVLENIAKESMYATNKMHAGWFDISDKCYNHHVQALKFLLIVKIYSRTRYNNRAVKTVSVFNRKVKNLSNK